MVRSTIRRLGSTTNLPVSHRRTILDVHLAADPGQALLKLRPLIARVGIELQQERIQSELRRHQQHAAIAILEIGCMHDGIHQQALRIDEDVPLLAFDLLAAIKARADRPYAPFLSAFDVLAVDHGRCRTGLAVRPFATQHIERVV